ncbi:FHA domain-containing protein DDL isoform X2 [Beta vulgaris subsp. vulgaris]|uniref:FHA domain-containing protein DDL isoform X2 n=1 Tax=Beta vulgaris subsp. vulgaris TaxID=3555 RepID=UPI0020369162|nr:FHA domain-containing protein DDL isoform X2 [Beta vulgaris subsp. vulgaris]
MSPSVARRSPKGHHSSRRSVSPERNHGEPRRRGRSPAAISRSSRSPSCRERSPVSHKSSHRDRGGSAVRERHSGRVKSPKRKKSSSPVPRSPSPRTKRLRRAQADYDEEALEREHESKHRKGSDKSKHERVHKERDFEKEVSKGRRERKSEKERDRGPRHRRSESPLDHHRHRGRHHSRSPPPASRSRARDEDEASRGAAHLDDGSDSLAMMEATEQALETKQKQKPSFALSGKLAEETNRVRGITLLFTEPPDARQPNVRWRLYVFKGGEVLNEPLYVHRQSCYLFGRERRVADIPTDHPSCSKQHAVLQYRQVEKEKPDGMMSKEVRPYLMDLGSTNKTFVNDNAIEPQRYYELFEKDTIRFGNSSREYVLLHENSNT